MTTPAVIEHLDVIDDILPGSRSAEIPHPKDLLDLEDTEETFCHSLMLAATKSKGTQFLGHPAAAVCRPRFLVKATNPGD